MTSRRARPASADDERWMRVALLEARKGDPSPNPHVGAVVVKHGRLIAKGHHPRAGQAHAEVMALARAGAAARGATLYVTFEPCNHFGRTPPCTDAILKAGVARVVVGARDMAPHKPGARLKLERAGVAVTMGVLEEAAGELVRDFAKHITEGLPYVTLKAAVTLDGRIADRAGGSKWITGEGARGFAHALRARHDAVLVGIGTVLADDPALNVRHVRGRPPVRVVLDSRLRTPPNAKVIRAPGGRTLIFHARSAPASRADALRRAGAETVAVPAARAGLSVRHVAKALAARGVVRLLLEGGAGIHGAFLDAGLVDRACIFVAPTLLGDPAAVPVIRGGARRLTEAFTLEPVRVARFGRDVCFMGPLAAAYPSKPARRRRP